MNNKHDYSTLFYFNPFPNWVYDIDTFEILDVNQCAINHYGYSKEEFLGLTIKELSPKEEVQKVIETHDGVDSFEGNINFGTFIHKKKNGVSIRVDINGHKVKFQGKNCIMAICQDVTIIEKQLLELQESEKKLKVASEIAKIGYWKFDINTNLLFWSDNVYDIWSIKKEDFEISFDYFFNSIHPDDRELFEREQEAALSGLKELNFVHRIILSNGDIKWVHEKGRLNKNPNGIPISFEGTVHDVTLQKKEEQHLKLLESVITHTNDAVLITEAETKDEPGPRIVYVNEAFTRMTGYTADEVIGKSPRILQGPKSDRNELARLGRALRNWESCEITTINYKKTGEEFWINLSVSPVANEKGGYTHWIAIERDVTAVKNEQFQKDFLANISSVFNDGIDLNISLERLCELIVNYGDFSFCEIWLPTIHQKALKLLSSVGMDAVAKKFYTHAEDIEEIRFDKGLPGKVWKRKESIIWGDTDIEKFFIRNNAAKKAGLKSVLGIPLIHQEKILGVMVIGTKEDVGKMNRHHAILTKIESFVGSKINRKRLESDLYHLFDSLPDIICIADLNGHFLKINRAGCDLLGYSEQEIIGNPFEKFTHALDKAIFTKEIKKLKKGETKFSFENRYVTKKNDVVWLSWHCNTLIEEGVIYATAKNITEEKKLRELVADASKMAKIGGWEIDLVINKLTWSDTVYEIHETDPSSYIPKLDLAINSYREDYQEYVANIIQKTIETGEPFDFEAALVTDKGNEKWVRAVGKAEIVNGKCTRVFGSFQDITQVKETEHRLQAITNDLPGVTFQYFIYPDGTNKLVYVSKASRKIWGVSPEMCENDNNIVWNQIKKGGDYEVVTKDIQHSLNTLSQWHSKWRNVLPNGELRWHEGYGTPYRLSNGTILFNSMIFDITDEVNVHQLYEETSQMAKIGSWELDLVAQQDADTMYWSPMVKKILEVGDDFNPSLTAGFEFYKDESKERIKKSVETLISKGVEFDEELEIVTLSGKEKWIRCIGKSQQVQDVTTKIFGSFQDINSMKTAELKIKEILESISDAFHALDKHWNFTYFNKEAENLLKRKSSEVLGKSIWKEFAPAKGTKLETMYRKVAKAGKPISFEYLYPGDGSWYELNVYPSSDGISSYFKNIDERKKAVEELQKAYKEKNQIIESIGDAFFTMDRDFTVTYWNRTAEKLIGIKKEVLLGKNLWDVFPDAVSLPSYANYHKVIKTGKPIMFEDYYGVWLEVNAYPSNDGISVFFRDITHRKEADERLLKAYDEKNQILESIGDAFFAVDKDWTVTYWNKEAEHVLGKKRDTILGKNLWEEYADAIDTDFYRQYHKAVATGKTVSFEEHYPTLNKWFEVTAYPNSNGLSVYFKEVTLRKETDIRILQANERFQKVTQAATDAIWDWDIENDIFYRGDGFEKLFGYPVRKKIKGDGFWKKSVHPKDLPKVQTSLYACLQDVTTEYWRQEYRIIHKGGEEKTVIDKGVVIRNEDGKAIRMVGAITDITHRAKHEKEVLELNKILEKHVKELEMSNEELEQFAFIASHDLQEPLRMISSFLNQIQRKYGDQLDEKAHQYIHFATDGAKRMKQIILDLLEYSRAGKLSDPIESINLNELIDDYRTLRRRLIKEKKATITVDTLPNIKCFRAPFVQVFHCLLDNAIKYSREKEPPLIKISVLDTDSYWQVSIEDNGIGIDSQFFDKIFIIFQRLHNRDKYEGTGIGLSIAKKHVEHWGGKIWVESELGAGSTFYFTVDKNIEI